MSKIVWKNLGLVEFVRQSQQQQRPAPVVSEEAKTAFATVIGKIFDVLAKRMPKDVFTKVESNGIQLRDKITLPDGREITVFEILKAKGFVPARGTDSDVPVDNRVYAVGNAAGLLTSDNRLFRTPEARAKVIDQRRDARAQATEKMLADLGI